MNKTILYSIVVLVIISIIVSGWYVFSSQAMITGGYTKCPRWKCTDTQTYTCPFGTTNYSCSSGVLTCYVCSTSDVYKNYIVNQTAVANQTSIMYVKKNYNVTWMDVANQTNYSTNQTYFVGIFNVNGETFSLGSNQQHTLSDGTYMHVYNVSYTYTSFYLKSVINDMKQSSFSGPPVQSTVITLNVSKNETVTLTGIYNINGESASLGVGQRKMLSDGTYFGVTTLLTNYSYVYLQSAYETKYASLTTPYPTSAFINLLVSKTQTCNPTTYSCTNWYLPSCSGNTLTCKLTGYYCSIDKPSSKCTQTGSCSYCPI